LRVDALFIVVEGFEYVFHHALLIVGIVDGEAALVPQGGDVAP
jgi:hypothetical protein